MKYNYEIIMYWSPEDLCFIAELPELYVCIAHGTSEFDALQNIKEAKELWIKTAIEFGDIIPEAKGRLVYA